MQTFLHDHAGLLRIITGDLLIVLALGLAIDVLFVMLPRIRAVVLGDSYRHVFYHELLLCAILLIFGLDVRFDLLARLNIGAFGPVLRVGVALFSAIVLFLGGRIIIGSAIDTSAPADYALVLGLALENGQPTPALLSRLDVAHDYWKAHPGVTLILTGGNPDVSGRTEAAAMRELLLKRGVPGERMILEDRAATTRENFQNTVLMLPPETPVVLISSDYHMDRSVRNARRAGFTRVLRLPAPSNPLAFGANLVWEVILELNDCLRG